MRGGDWQERERHSQGKGWHSAQGKHQAPLVPLTHCKPPVHSPMCLTRSGCTHGRQQELLGDKQGDEKREKRHFQLQCHWPDCWLLFAIAAAARCAPAPLQCLHSCTSPLGRRPGWVLRCLHQAAVGKSQQGAGQWGEAEPGGSCPSLPALPGRGVTSSTGFCLGLGLCLALEGAPGESRVGFGISRKLSVSALLG